MAVAATGRADTVAILMKLSMGSAVVCAAPAAAFPVEIPFDPFCEMHPGEENCGFRFATAVPSR